MEMYGLALKLIIIIDNLEKQEDAFQIESDINGNNKTSILMFLPGINEIDNMYRKLDRLKDTEK